MQILRITTLTAGIHNITARIKVWYKELNWKCIYD